MIRLLPSIFLSLVLCPAVNAQSPKSPRTAVPPIPTGKKYIIQNPVNYFEYVLNSLTPLNKDPFETDEQYKNREAKRRFDTGMVYFSLNPPSEEFAFTYDHTAQELTIEASGATGDYVSYWNGIHAESDKVYAFRIGGTLTDSEYVGNNSFGAVTKVKSYTTTNYIVRLYNGGVFPSQINGKPFYDTVVHHSIKFFLRVKTNPDKGREFVKNAEILIGLTPIKNAEFGKELSATHEPTFQEPWDTTEYRCYFSGNLREIVLRDQKTKKVYQVVNIPAPSTTLAPTGIDARSPK